MSLLLAFLVQDPADLVRSLASPDVEVRARAADQVVEGGRRLLDRVRALAPEDPELRARLEDAELSIARAERLRGFEGGEPVNGISARLELEVDRCTQDLAVTLEIANVSGEEILARRIRSWSHAFPAESLSRGGSEAKVIVRQIEGDRIRGGRYRGSYACGSGRAAPPVDRLAPGERASASHRIAARTLPDGIHEVTVEYQPTGAKSQPRRIRVNQGIPELLAP